MLYEIKTRAHNLYPAKSVEDLSVKLHYYSRKALQNICTNYSHRFQQNMLNFLLGANRPGAKRLGGRNDQGRNDLGRNAAGAKRLGGELDLGRNDPDSLYCILYRSCKCKSKVESFTTHRHKLNTSKYMYKKGWTQSVFLRRGGGGAMKAKGLNQGRKQRCRKSM